MQRNFNRLYKPAFAAAAVLGLVACGSGSHDVAGTTTTTARTETTAPPSSPPETTIETTTSTSAPATTLSPETSTPVAATTTIAAAVGANACVYQIQPGDSLSSIGDKFSLKIAAMMDENPTLFPTRNPNDIKAFEDMDVCVGNGINDVTGKPQPIATTTTLID